MRKSAQGTLALTVSDVGGPEIVCEVIRARRKTLAVQVRQGRVQVRAPWYVSQTAIREWLDGHRDWVQERLRQDAERQAQMPRIEPGGRVFYQARDLPVRFEAAARGGVDWDERRCLIRGPDLDTSKATRILEQWLKAEAARVLPERARALARHLRVDHKCTDVRLRKTRSTWGYCTSAGVLQFNWLIMLAPHAVVDYIIAHEVCHLVHLNHSRAFWRLVESVCPEAQSYRRWLRRNEHRFWLTPPGQAIRS